MGEYSKRCHLGLPIPLDLNVFIKYFLVVNHYLSGLIIGIVHFIFLPAGYLHWRQGSTSLEKYCF